MGMVRAAAAPRPGEPWLPEAGVAARWVPSAPGGHSHCPIAAIPSTPPCPDGAPARHASDGRTLSETLQGAARVARLEHRAYAALAVLVWTARRGEGWPWAEVGGWMLHREMNALAEAAGLQMPCTLDALTRRGLITCREVRDRGGGRIYLYRARDPGARALDAALGWSLAHDTPVREEDARDDPEILFMPLGAWAALSGLRDGAERPDGKRRWDARGWLTSAELSDSLGRAACFDTTDLYWLERRELIERRYGRIAVRRRSPPLYWRVKALGLRAGVLDDFGLASGLSTLLQVGLSTPAEGHERGDMGDLVTRHRTRLADPPPLATAFVRDLLRESVA